MIEHYIRQAYTLKHLQSNPLGGGLKKLTAYLIERRHTPYTIHLYLRAAAHFGRWLKQQRLDPASKGEIGVSSLLYKHFPTCHYTPPGMRSLKELRPVLRRLLAALRRIGRISAPPLIHLSSIDQEVVKFEDYLQTKHCLADDTILYRARYLREFLKAKDG